MPERDRCQIRCSVCDQWADSRVQFDSAEAFFSSSLIGGKTRCSWCGEETTCSAERMRFDERREGRMGTYVEGSDARFLRKRK